MYRPDQGSHYPFYTKGLSGSTRRSFRSTAYQEKQPSESERYAVDEGTDWQRNETPAIWVNQINQP
jgi:hypothetical protein